MFKNILIPTDGSPLSQKAVVQGVALAKSVGAKVTGVLRGAARDADRLSGPSAGRLRDARRARADDRGRLPPSISDFVERAAKKAGVSCESVHVTSDYPEEGILKVAQKKKCDLIVMATHGQGGLRGMFIGSVTQKVLNQAKIPVMVFR